MNLGECFLELANMEEEAANLYKEFSEICSENLKDVIIKLSDEEKKHIGIVYKVSENIKFKEKELGELVNKVFKQQVDYMNVKDKSEILTKEKNFFIFALQMEKNSIEIYTELLKLFKQDSQECKNFEMLLNEEKNHMIYVLNQLHELK